MLKNTVFWDTLNAVEQLEVVFDRTLQTIDSINNRYKMLAIRKKAVENRQFLYETEIQAAITEPTKIAANPVKRKKRPKKRIPPHLADREKTKRPIIFVQTYCCEEANEKDASIDINFIHQEEADPNARTRDSRASSNGCGRSEDSEQTDPKLCSSSAHCCSSCRCQTYYLK